MNKIFFKQISQLMSQPVGRANQLIMLMVVFMMAQTSYAFAEQIFSVVGTGVVRTIALIYIAYKVITLVWDSIQKFFSGGEGAMNNVFPIAGYIAVGIAWTPFWQLIAQGAADLLNG